MTTANSQSVQEKLDDFLSQKNFFTDALQKVEEKSGIHKKYILAGLVVLFAIYLVHGLLPGVFVGVIGFVYPAYKSVKAIESERKDDDTQMLIYWVVFGTFQIVEYFTDFFLSWFPLYFLFKCAFLLWCMVPFPWNGSDFLYGSFIKPFFLKHEEVADSYIKKGAKIVNELVHETETKLKETVMENITTNDDDRRDSDVK